MKKKILNQKKLFKNKNMKIITNHIRSNPENKTNRENQLYVV